ncbi:MAG: DUF1566 domain-containing protein [Rhodocyclales bacterium]|nr:DUF1566 domain-containing protein [Rhodocyclales bacterium]
MSTTQLPSIGAPFEGGFFGGLIRINEQTFALVRAPKATGQHDDIEWHGKYDAIPGAQSWNDGLANTQAMAAAGSEIAQWALAQRIADHADWYIPAMDELEVLYRNLKPTTNENSPWGRSGLNVSAVPPTYPYALDVPLQTPAEDFQDGGVEALDSAWYWSSTQHAGYDDYAWCQLFGNGYQSYNRKDYDSRVVLVRRVAT